MSRLYLSRAVISVIAVTVAGCGPLLVDDIPANGPRVEPPVEEQRNPLAQTPDDPLVTTTGRWGATTYLSETLSGYSSRPKVGFDATGGALTVWFQDNAPPGFFDDGKTQGLAFSSPMFTCVNRLIAVAAEPSSMLAVPVTESTISWVTQIGTEPDVRGSMTPKKKEHGASPPQSASAVQVIDVSPRHRWVSNSSSPLLTIGPVRSHSPQVGRLAPSQFAT